VTRWLYVAVAALLGTLAGRLLGRTSLSEGAKDALAASGGVAIAGTILLARAVVYFASGGGESASFVGLDLPARPLMLILVVVATAALLVGAHLLLTRSGALPAGWMQHGRPAIIGTIASSVAAWLLLAGYWESH
jgi:hypothetical protein